MSDLGPDQSPVTDLESDGVPPDRVELTGAVLPSEEAVVVVLGGEEPTGTVTIDVARSVVIGDSRDGDRPVERIVVVDPAQPSSAPLSPVSLLAALMAAATDHADDPLLLDALAGLAETVPGVAVADQALASVST